MYLIRNLKFLLLSAFVGALGLAVFSSSLWINTPLQQGEQTNKFITVDGELRVNQNSSGTQEIFEQIEYQLKHTPIKNKSALENEIIKLTDTFQKNYLLALLSKRNGDFQKSYNLLSNVTGLSSGYLPYYDELVDAANITGNLDVLREQIYKNKELNKNYFLYINGLISYKKGNYNEALKNFKQLLDNNFYTKEVYFWLAYFYRGTGDYQNGLELLKKSSELTEKNDLFLPRITLAMGSLYYLSGNYEKSEEFYRKGYKQAKKLKNTIEEIRGLANIAIILDETGDVENARKNLKIAIRKAEAIENLGLLAYLHSELGVSYTYTNRIIQARENYTKSYKLYTRLNNRERLSYLSNNIGSIYLQLANFKEALKYYNEGLEFASENKLGQILNLTGIADVYANMANYAKALEYYHKARQLAESIKDISSVVKVDIGLGALFYNVNRPRSALKYLYGAEEKINADDMPFIASDIYLKIGVVEASLKNYEKANGYFKKGLKLTKAIGDVYYNLVIKTEYANLLIEQIRLSEAEKLLRDAEKVSRKYGLTQLTGLQELYFGKISKFDGNYKAAAEHFKNAFELGSETNDYQNRVESGYLLAQLYREEQRFDEAEKWFKKTIDIVEEVSKPLFNNQELQIAHFSGINEIYDSLIDLYLTKKRYKEAFEYLERSRSRNTLRNLVNLKLINSPVDEDKINRYVDLKWMIFSNLYDENEVSGFRQELEGLKKEFSAKNKNLAKLLDNNPALSTNEIQNGLGNNDYLISFFVSDDYIQVFKLTKSGFTSEKINVGRIELTEMIKEITPLYKADISNDELFVNQDLFAFNAFSAAKLYKQVFEPVLKNIPENKNVIFSLSYEMLTVPVEFLVTNWDDSQSSYYYGDKRFLIEKYPISYAPSASIYVRQRNVSDSEEGKILLVGDPNLSNDEFSISYRGGLLEDESFSARNIELFPLEFSKREIESIDRLLSNDVIFTSDDATENNLKENAPESKIIHLSTHSFLFKDQPLIILSQTEDDNEDGFLEMGEIVQMNLNTNLVVLSSCRSGLGKIDEAEGILGMQKSFFEAGAHSIIVTLWDVNDKYTSVFMEDFYKHLTEGKTKTEALRMAKIDFIKNYSPNPYYWSAFVLAGDVSKVALKSRPSDLFYYLLGIAILIASAFILRQRYDLYRKQQSGKIY